MPLKMNKKVPIKNSKSKRYWESNTNQLISQGVKTYLCELIPK